VGVAQAADEKCKELGIQVVHKEGYAATSTDLASLVTKLRRARPDVLLHVGYNPDITLFLRQAKEAGLKFSALIGHGAGYSQYGKLEETFGKDVNLVMDVDPVASQLLDAKALAPGVGEMTQEMLKRWQAQGGTGVAPPHLSMGFNNTYIFLTDVLPRAIKKYGGVDTESLRKAALDADIPIGGTMQGYGVKFFPPGHQMAGQNERSIAVVMQYVDGKTTVVWPKQLRTAEPVMPLPAGHAYAP
jgi:branched-chain amino acid transport system substrate-binding protein